MRNFLLVVSTILALLAPTTYIVSIIRGRSKPHRTTRFVVLVVVALIFLGTLSAHGNNGTKMLTTVTLLSSMIIFGLSLRRGMGGWSLFDRICLLIALIGIIGWRVTGNPITAIVLAILADTIAYLPAIAKTWRHPQSESHWFYSLSLVAAFLSLLTYKLTLVSIFQLAIIVDCFVMLTAVYHKKVLSYFSRQFKF